MQKLLDTRTVAPWLGAVLWALWGLVPLGFGACGGDDSSQTAACQVDEDCPSGKCNLDTHQCESNQDVDAGNEADGAGQTHDADVTQDADTTQDGGGQAQDGEVAECSADDDCTDPTQPICEQGSCRGCSEDSECSSRWSDRPHCDSGRCIGVCGNGHLDEGEECDTQEFGGKTCSSETGLAQGDLRCTADCHIDTSACHECGNGILEGDEACDGAQLGGKTCSSETGLAQGDLSCNANCQIDTTACHECGNGVLEPGEECDGQDLGGKTCSSETGLAQGDLHCTGDCRIDRVACYQCGNGTKEGPEVCDGANLDGHSCADFGFELGNLACSSDCMSFDQSNCTNCGNGTCDDGETTGSCPEDCGWVDLAAGRTHTCGVKADGTLWCWGENDKGQLGNGVFGNNVDEPAPVQVANLTGVTSVSLGGKHTCALGEGGALYCWGDDSRWQIRPAINNSTVQVIPYDMQQASSRYGLVTGDGFTCWGVRSGFLSDSLSITCRGDNTMGEIGNGSTSNTPVGTPYELATHFTKMFTSMRKTQCGTTHYFSTSQNRFVDEVRCWGANDSSQAIPGSTTNVTTPTVVSQLDAVAGGCGDTFSCGIDQAGTVRCWGSNDHYQRGLQSVPSTAWNVVPLGTSAAGLAVGGLHACAWTNDGRLFCWGSNYHYASKPGDLAHSRVLPGEVTLPNNETVAKAVAGLAYTCVLTDSKRIYCWGGNEKGQVGIGSFTSWGGVSSPTEVVDPYGE